jgi:hypothetical protein
MFRDNCTYFTKDLASFRHFPIAKFSSQSASISIFQHRHSDLNAICRRRHRWTVCSFIGLITTAAFQPAATDAGGNPPLFYTWWALEQTFITFSE